MQTDYVSRLVFKIRKVIDDELITAVEFTEKTGIYGSSLSKIRRGIADIERISLKTAKGFEDVYNELYNEKDLVIPEIVNILEKITIDRRKFKVLQFSAFIGKKDTSITRFRKGVDYLAVTLVKADLLLQYYDYLNKK